MCFFNQGGSGSTEVNTPAPAPNAPLPAADAPKIGETRREENLKNFGTDSPEYRVRGSSRDEEDYRVDREGKRPDVNPSALIRM